MYLSELEFEKIGCEMTFNLELINDFIEMGGTPIHTGRQYKGCGGGYPIERLPHRFGLREKLRYDNTIKFGNDNILLNFEPENN